MADVDNKLGSARSVELPMNRLDRVGPGDLDDLYTFSLNSRSRLSLSLLGVAPGAGVRVELYALARPLNNRLKTTNFRKLTAAERRRFLRPISATGRDDLAVGTYFVRVFRVRGSSNYRLRMSAEAVVDPSPITISRNPDGPTYEFTIDFSRSLDANSATDRGLFVGAIQGTVNVPEKPEVMAFTSLASDLTSIRHADGRVEYRAKLLKASSLPDVSLNYDVLFVRFILPASYNADPDSLLSLRQAFNADGSLKGDVYFAYGGGKEYVTWDDIDALGEQGYKDAFMYSSSMDGGAGNDILIAGPTFDALSGGEGNDQLYGGDAIDTLDGGSGDDFLDAGNDNDDLSGAAGNDTLDGGNGNDFLSGGNGNDSLFGRAGNDTLGGDEGNDSLFGGAGDDFLQGEAGSDIIFGGVGNDTLTGGGPSSYNSFGVTDSLTGGDGADSFILGDNFYSYYSGDGYAVIEDWWPSEGDRIQARGDATLYQLVKNNDVLGTTAIDTELYYFDGTTSNRIAVFKDTTDVIISLDFTFV
ncbi:calcium-binding protein [Leptolyngbya sp. FACHB-16]|uniref:calcium-binding protein n=1 Tax=unclassified Leptolyngbya TaxID=2650499 RepID=UPI0018EFBD3A|nr:calcium-binding protein [Leptolyngbya sp. FACHB-16]